MQGEQNTEQGDGNTEEQRALVLYDAAADEKLAQTATMSDQDLTTGDVPESLRRHLAEQIRASQAQFISISIPERPEPLVFDGSQVIGIGRRDESAGIVPSVDFTPHQGVQLGVSRRHAEITYREGQFFIKDLRSANGTWLNDLKLVPEQFYHISTGDRLRFGQILCTVKLHQTVTKGLRAHEASADIRLHQLILRGKSHTLDPAPAQDGIHMKAMSQLHLYCAALEQLHHTLRAAHIMSEYPMTIRGVRFERSNQTLVLELFTSAQVIEFISQDLPAAARKIKTETSNLEAQQVCAGLAALALESLTLEVHQRATLTEQLTTAFTALMRSPLEVVA